MTEDEVLKYLANQTSPPRAPVVGPAVRRATRPAPAAREQKAQKKPQDGYQNFSASHLFCPKCTQAMPVREKLMLYLPTGILYDYCCERCGTSVGTRKTGI